MATSGARFGRKDAAEDAPPRPRIEFKLQNRKDLDPIRTTGISVNRVPEGRNLAP